MYATVRRYAGITDPAEVGRRVHEGFVPVLRDIPGLVAYHWLDAGGGIMVSMSVFEDQAGAEASNEKAAAWIPENAAGFFPNPPEVTSGEVVAHG